MSKYYFLSCSLPSLSFEKPPEITFESFKLLLSLNLNKKDSEKIIRMRQLIDLQNLRCMWSNKPVDSRGNLSIKEIEEALLVYDFFPSYVFDFIEKYKDNESRLRLFPYLISKFFQEETNQFSGFFYSYLKFEREVRLILTALRSKFLKKDITFELQFEDPTDSFVNYILVQKDAESFTPPQEYQSLNAIFKKYYQDPIIFHRHLLQYRFEKVEEMIEGKSFAIDEILVYMIKLILIEDWNYLNKNKGKEIIDSLI